MNRITLLELLLVLPFPIWPTVAFWVVRRVASRQLAPWVGLLVALVSAALAVGFFVIFSHWLQQPQFANAAAIIYGAPAFFLLLFAVAIWWLKRCEVQQISGNQAVLGDQTSTASGEDKSR